MGRDVAAQYLLGSAGIPGVHVDYLSAAFGALIALVAAYTATRYERALTQRDQMDRLSLRLASVAVRLRRAVLAQFVKTESEEWIPSALYEQNGVLADLDALMQELEQVGGATVRCALAARESLWSNIVTLNRWQTSWQGQEPLTGQLGPVEASHHDLWGASSLLTRSVDELGDKRVRRRAQSLGADIKRLREDARRDIIPGVEEIQALSEDAREAWVRTGSLPSRPA